MQLAKIHKPKFNSFENSNDVNYSNIKNRNFSSIPIQILQKKVNVI